MAENMNPIRGDVGNAEATRDPIFLLEVADFTYSAEGLPSDVTYDHDAEGFILVRDKDKPLDDVETLDMARLHDLFPDHVVKTWTCKNHVFFTREEATAWAEARTYRWPWGWRVWCCCAEGELATILRSRTMHPTGTVCA